MLLEKEAKDLSRVAPRSPRERIGGFAILARTIDKCRATIQGTHGDYHFDCPVDRTLFGFKGITGDEFRQMVESGANDEEIGEWLKVHGTPRTEDEIEAWSDRVTASSPMDGEDEGKKDWFRGVCEGLNLDPETTSLFDYLEADDEATFG
jgi:hypothetical protein